MKKIVIGGFVFIGGLLTTLLIILAGAIYATSITSWSGNSKLWFAIFGSQQYGNEVVESLFLGIPFSLGLVATVVGLAILGNEYYKLIKSEQKNDE